MSKERLNVTQGLCDHVQILMKGGATAKTAGFLTGISQSTVSRIMAAGYDAEQFKANTEQRRVEEQRKRKQKLVEVDGGLMTEEESKEYMKMKEELHCLRAQEKTDQVPGQMHMDLPGPDSQQDMNKMMRFQAAQVDKIIMKLDQLNNNVCQMLRAVYGK